MFKEISKAPGQDAYWLPTLEGPSGGRIPRGTGAPVILNRKHFFDKTLDFSKALGQDAYCLPTLEGAYGGRIPRGTDAPLI